MLLIEMQGFGVSLLAKKIGQLVQDFKKWENKGTRRTEGEN
jgi:hypothetical protein